MIKPASRLNSALGMAGLAKAGEDIRGIALEHHTQPCLDLGQARACHPIIEDIPAVRRAEF
ncbi:hypothetical protein SAMN07250955_11137 [Arboricoccus pini]|uniref:Uncharacterized protein n=1 Tax=Arboricoccus pini TaxID=1963835 RepID=A0A212RNB7_9PROT|nr:hypothetical protein SAMN07250955_11137 [Arboricoccus pini]